MLFPRVKNLIHQHASSVSCLLSWTYCFLKMNILGLEPTRYISKNWGISLKEFGISTYWFWMQRHPNHWVCCMEPLLFCYVKGIETKDDQVSWYCCLIVNQIQQGVHPIILDLVHDTKFCKIWSTIAFVLISGLALWRWRICWRILVPVGSRKEHRGLRKSRLLCRKCDNSEVRLHLPREAWF